jgi:hypothetical protein
MKNYQTITFQTEAGTFDFIELGNHVWLIGVCGKVLSLPFVKGYSMTKIEAKIKGF